MSGLVIDDAWATRVLGKLNIIKQAPSGSKTLRPKQGKAAKIETNRAVAGYAWHNVVTPARPILGSRSKIDSRGIISVMDIAGRPMGKHLGAQGQHTTAFGANREAVLSATIGRKPDQARIDMALLFSTLKSYPAFTDPSQPKPPENIEKLLTALSDPRSRISANYSIEQLSNLYLEIRDALPGASLNTGASGKASKSSSKNTAGKGEGSSLAYLRSAETQALKGTKIDAATVVTRMMELYDKTSEVTAKMSPEDAKAQQTTFLMSIAQAFPKCFLSVSKALVTKLDRLAANADLSIQPVCQQLSQNNTTQERPQPRNFIAGVKDGQISFVGRSDSLKDGGTMGDHTCAETLMKQSASAIILPAGSATTNGGLVAGLGAIRKQFGTDVFAVFDRDIDESFPAYMFTARLGMLEQHLDDLDTLIARFSKLDANAAPIDANIIEAAEQFMQLVDDRPTAVNYGAPAKGRGEGTTVANLAEFEEDLEDENHDPGFDEVFDAAVNLLDVIAAFKTADTMRDYVGATESEEASSQAFNDCIEVVAKEFLFFLKHAYPNCFDYLDSNNDDLTLHVTSVILDKGSRSDDTDDDYQSEDESYESDDDSGSDMDEEEDDDDEEEERYKKKPRWT